MKKIQVLFLLLCISLLSTPLLLFNTEPISASTLDNRFLTPLPETLSGWIKNGENIIKDRIGLRKEMILTYNSLLKYTFHHMEHSTLMEGEKNHLFFSYSNYIDGFQAMDYTQSDIENDLAQLNKINNFCRNNSVDFLYMNIPDKKTIYSEYFPKSIKPATQLHKNEALEKSLATSNIPHIFLKKPLLEAKLEGKIPPYNFLHDVGHFNAYGAHIVHRAVLQKLTDFVPDIQILSANEYSFSNTSVNLETFANIYGEETIPVLENTKKHLTYSKIETRADNPEFFLHAYNPTAQSNKSIIFIGDSYLQVKNPTDKIPLACYYYTPYFKNVYFQRSSRVLELPIFFKKFKPDILVLETVERVAVFPFDALPTR